MTYFLRLPAILLMIFFACIALAAVAVCIVSLLLWLASITTAVWFASAAGLVKT